MSQIYVKMLSESLSFMYCMKSFLLESSTCLQEEIYDSLRSKKNHSKNVCSHLSRLNSYEVQENCFFSVYILISLFFCLCNTAVFIIVLSHTSWLSALWWHTDIENLSFSKSCLRKKSWISHLWSSWTQASKISQLSEIRSHTKYDSFKICISWREWHFTISVSLFMCLSVYDLRIWHWANKTFTENYLQLSLNDSLCSEALDLEQTRAVLIIYIWFIYSYSTSLTRELLMNC